MKELAKLRIREVDQRINEMPFDELDEKIDLIYSLGYIYNPYIKEFFNPFINQGLKALVVYNLDLERIKNLHEGLEEDFLEANNKIRNIDEIKSSIYKNDTGSGLFLFLASESVIFSILSFIVTIIAHIFGGIKIATITIVLSFILINCYLVYNLLFAKNENEDLLSPLWLKYKNILLVFSLVLYPYSYYLLYMTFDSLLIPALIIFPIRFLIQKYMTKKLSIRYWQRSIMKLKYN
jgi:hypothetical protein